MIHFNHFKITKKLSHKGCGGSWELGLSTDSMSIHGPGRVGGQVGGGLGRINGLRRNGWI